MKKEFVLVGAGIAGLSTAFELARRGASVGVIELSEQLGGTSWNAVGTLPNNAARRTFSPLRQFYLQALKAYPSWLEAINTVLGREAVVLEKSEEYCLFNAKDGTENLALARYWRRLRREGATAGKGYYGVPSFLKAQLRQSPFEKKAAPSWFTYHLPASPFVSPKRLLKALKEAGEKLGVEFYFNHCLEKFRLEGGTVRLQLTTGFGNTKQLLCGCLVLAAGVWSAALLSRHGYRLRLYPTKGEGRWIEPFLLPDAEGNTNVLLRFFKGYYLLQRGGRAGGNEAECLDRKPIRKYPQPDALWGATEELRNWAAAVSPEGGETLSRRFRECFEASVPLKIRGGFSGMRTRNQDKAPLFGFLEPKKRLALTSGHYKSGFGLAPLAAKNLAALLLGEAPANSAFNTFSPGRTKGGVQRYGVKEKAWLHFPLTTGK